MALRGNLKDFSLTQLFNLINLASKTGTLHIESSKALSWLAFREGKLACAQYGEEDNSLAAILLRDKKITPTQHKILVDRSKFSTDKELGLMLINAGFLSQKDILETLKNYYINIIRKMFAQMDGFFHFDLTIDQIQSKIPVKVDLENLIIEGSRQKQEWDHLMDEIPTLQMALKFADRPGANIRKVHLSVDEWRVVSYVNPKNTMEQICKATKMSDLEIRRAVFSLLQAGLVEIVKPGGIPVISRDKMFPTTNPDEQKNMLDKLIKRITAI